MTVVQLRKKLIEKINSADTKKLKRIDNFIDHEMEEDDFHFKLTAQQKKELDEQWERIERGEEKLLTYEEFKQDLSAWKKKRNG